ncbi:ArpU family phage packaging/lysis transcriptional regulator [Priestia endophytica]|uniref:ArpU family phage packaging/lysis transcriptional regulator n=1 Tax=Priestia endophytica TaxID=135735 RepID=UPI00203C9398|nr:ArpU family phage packaging/lysis transcriptional regulator [Priestia endophytica]MCM3536579.1 ArpU family transcriptional regulator [Priestia endophytica]
MPVTQINKREMRKLVIEQLKDYRALKIQLQNKQEREEAGAVDLFPVIRTGYLTELKIKQIERALNHTLDFLERTIIEQRYLKPTQIKDIEIYMNLGLSKNSFYNIRNRALETIATALGMI